jgi:hypothetical protein
MILISTLQQAAQAGRRRRFDPVDGPFDGYTDFLFESGPEQPAGPQAFLVHQAAGCVLPAHFHLQHQIQVVVGGSGMLGRHEVHPGSVHYASPQSAYGPLVAGPDGLEYFTLRAKTDKGAWYLPESRPAMQSGLRKEQITAAPAWSDPDTSACTLIPLREDRLGAWFYRKNAGEVVVCDAAASASGRFHVILRGAFECQGQRVPHHACVYWTPPDEAPRFEAAEPDSVLIVVQFPESALHCEAPSDLPVDPTRQASTVIPGPLPGDRAR